MKAATATRPLSRPSTSRFDGEAVVVLEVTGEEDGVRPRAQIPTPLIQTWNQGIQGWNSYWTHAGSGSTDFPVPLGAGIVVEFEYWVPPFQSRVGRVPRPTELSLAPMTGHNVMSWPLTTYEPLASEYLPQSPYSGVELWDPPTQSTAWHYGNPGDPDFTLSACAAFGGTM